MKMALPQLVGKLSLPLAQTKSSYFVSYVLFVEFILKTLDKKFSESLTEPSSDTPTHQ